MAIHCLAFLLQERQRALNDVNYIFSVDKRVDQSMLDWSKEKSCFSYFKPDTNELPQ